MESATESIPPLQGGQARFCGKGEMACVRDHRAHGNMCGSVNPIRSKSKQEAIEWSALSPGRALELIGNGKPR